MAPGTYYIGGYLYSGGKPTYSHLTQSINIAAALTLAAPREQVPTSLPGNAVLESQAELTPIVNEAIRRLASIAGSQVLASVSVQIADLPGNLLGEDGRADDPDRPRRGRLRLVHRPDAAATIPSSRNLPPTCSPPGRRAPPTGAPICSPP